MHAIETPDLGMTGFRVGANLDNGIACWEVSAPNEDTGSAYFLHGCQQIGTVQAAVSPQRHLQLRPPDPLHPLLFGGVNVPIRNDIETLHRRQSVILP